MCEDLKWGGGGLFPGSIVELAGETEDTLKNSASIDGKQAELQSD
jgi:hypothetical protein